MDAGSVSRALSAVACACAKLTTEIFDEDGHGRNRALQIAADVSERCRVGDSVESTSDVAFSGRKGEPIGEKAHDWNERQKNDAGTDGERGEHASQPVERK